MKTIINVECMDQELVITNSPVIASGGVHENFIAFNFCEKWDGFGKTAVFYRNEKERFYSVLGPDDVCEIPHEVTDYEGNMYFGVYGEAGEVTRTSKILKYKISKGAMTTLLKPSEEPTPDIYQQLLSAYGQTNEAIARETAEREASMMAEESERNRAINTAILAEENARKQADATEKTERQAEIAVERARINALIALEEPHEASDVEREIEDIKVKADGTKAETAGVAVREQISGLDAKIAENTNQLSSEIADVVGDYKSQNLFNKNDNTIIRGKFLTYEGGFQNNENFGTSHYMEVEPNKGYIVYYDSDFKILKNTAKAWYDENKELIGVSHETNVNTAPENAKYMRATIGLNYLDTIMVVESTVNITEYIPYSPLESLARKDIELSNSIEIMKPYFRTANIFDKTNDGNVEGKYISMTGDWVSDANFGETHYMEVVGGKSYICYYSDELKQMKSIAKIWYDENKEQIGISYNEIASIAPSNAKYLRVTFGLSYIDSYMVVESSTVVTEYIPYYSYKKVEEKSHWYGKKWYAYGTSITSVAQGKYVPYVSMLSGLEVVNKGIGGGALVTNRNIFNALMDNTDGKTEADLITIEVGANDSTAPLGEITSMDTDTFCGALNTCIKNVLTNCPNAQVVIMASTRGRYKAGDSSNLYTLDYQTANGVTIYERDKAVEQVAFANGVYFIPFNALGLGLFREQASNLYNVDNIHHTNLGGYNLAHGVWSYLKNIPLWYTEIK